MITNNIVQLIKIGYLNKMNNAAQPCPKSNRS